MLKEKYLNADEKFEKLLYKTGMVIGVLLIAALCIIEILHINVLHIVKCSFHTLTGLSGVWWNESCCISVKRRFIKIIFISSICVILCYILHIIYGKGNIGIYLQ